MSPWIEGIMGISLILATLVVVFVVIDLPRGLGLFSRLVLIGLWFWWIGWEALLGLVILEFIGGGTLIVNPLSKFFWKQDKTKAKTPSTAED